MSAERADAPAPIGPGRLVLVVGPSGAGKDTLIRAAREALSGDERFFFPRRVVTRPPSAAEENEFCEVAAFQHMTGAGRFSVAWSAHGHHYGIPRTVDLAIAAGRSVVCNVSRTVVEDLRARYAHVLVVEVTASPEVLAARLALRARAEDGDLSARASRSVAVSAAPDAVIVNDGTRDAACSAFMAALA